jgi:hypothetical protein
VEQSKSNEVALDVNLEEEDAYKFNLRQTYKSPGVRSAIIIALIGLVYFLYSLWRMITEGYRPPIQSYFFLIILAGLIYLPVYIRKSVHKAVKANKFSQQTMHCRFTDKEIQIRTGKSHVELSWDKVFGVIEDKDYFAVYTGKSQMLLIPKRFFSKSEYINTLRCMVVKSLPRDKYSLRAAVQRV